MMFANRSALLLACSIVIFLCSTAVAKSNDPIKAASVIPTTQIEYAMCVGYQESRDNYLATNSMSSAQGRWQFLDSKWRRGLSYMTEKRLIEFGMDIEEAKTIRETLKIKPINTWKPVFQDIGFLAVLNAKYQWSGWKHWYIKESKCNDLVPQKYNKKG